MSKGQRWAHSDRDDWCHGFNIYVDDQWYKVVDLVRLIEGGVDLLVDLDQHGYPDNASRWSAQWLDDECEIPL